MPTQKILVIEDEPCFEILIDSAMDEQGFHYDWFVRAQETSAGISFTRLNGTTEIVDLSNYWVALCDNQLKGSAMQGCELTGCLTSKGLPVVAISSEDSLNNMMITTGAIFGIRKDKLWFELHQGKIKLPELVENARSCQFG